MILQLSVRGLAVVGEVTLDFGPGFTVITGETGAGKTMLVHAIDLLRGGKPDAGRIADGVEELVVEATFRLPTRDTAAHLWTRLAEIGAATDDGELIVCRVVRPGGRSSATVGGKSAPLAVLSEITDELLALHGQHSARLLTRADNHRRLLDACGSPDHQSHLDAYRAAYRKLSDVEQAIHRAENARQSDEVVVAALTRLIDDVVALGISPGEESEIRERGKALQDSLSAQTSMLEALTLLSNDDGAGASELLGRVQRVLEVADHSDGEGSQAVTLIDAASRNVREAMALLLELVDGADEQARELESIHARRGEISAIVRRHGAVDADDLLARAETAREQLREMAPADIAALERERQSLAAETARLGELISAGRAAAAVNLGASVNATLGDLGFSNSAFSVAIESVAPQASGHDAVDFRLATRAGADPVSITTSASGGEMSRVALALTAVVARADVLPALVFDEVDAGIGGNTAHAVARCLASMAQETQVVAVTHLPQVAALAARHWVVAATAKGAVIREVESDARVVEMCRMLGVDPEDAAARSVAVGMLSSPPTPLRS